MLLPSFGGSRDCRDGSSVARWNDRVVERGWRVTSVTVRGDQGYCILLVAELTLQRVSVDWQRRPRQRKDEFNASKRSDDGNTVLLPTRDESRIRYRADVECKLRIPSPRGLGWKGGRCVTDRDICIALRTRSRLSG